MRLPIILCAVLAACAQFPELDGTITPEVKNASPPALVPLRSILERADTVATTPRTLTSDVASRLDVLQNRAARLRGPVIDQRTRSRMLRGVR